VHPTLVQVGPWSPAYLPLVFLFFLAIVAAWTHFERRQDEERLRLTPALGLELFVQAAIPTAVTYLLVNRIGPLVVRSYGVMLLLAFVAALTWMYLDRDRYGLTGGQVLHTGLLGFAGGILGARVGYVLLNWGEYSGDVTATLDLWRGGMSWHGGLAGGLLVLGIATRAMGVSFARVFDLAAPGVALGYAVARVGCFLNGCCYGRASDLPWAVTFPQIGGHSPPPVPVHPTHCQCCCGSVPGWGSPSTAS